MKTKFTKKGRRILSAALCLLMMITALPMSAFAWTSEEGKSCTSSFGDYYVGSDGEYYRSKATYSFIVYDSKGNITVQSINAGNAKRKYLMTDNSGTHQVYCVESGVDFNTGNSYVSKSGKNSSYFQNLPTDAQFGIMMALMYGWHEGKSSPVAGTNADDYAFATQTIIWEYQQQLRTSPSNRQSANGIDGDTYYYSLKGRPAEKCYNWILSQMSKHYTIPSFAARSQSNADTYTLKYNPDTKKYSLTLEDTNNTLSDIKFSASGISVTRSGNKYTFTSDKMITSPVTVSAQKNVNLDCGEMLIWGCVGKQTMVSGASDPVYFYLKIDTETYGTGQIKKTSEDGVVSGISFNISGNGVNKTVTTGADGTVDVQLMPGVYTVTEQSIDRYEPQSVQRVTIVSGHTATVTFNNTLKRGSLEIIKNSEDNLVEGVKFHLYGTSLSGLPVDEYAVTDENGVARFENVLISGETPYTVEEVDTAIRYVVPESQTAPIEWEKVTSRSFTNILKKFNVTVTKSDVETGTAQGDASLAGAVYGIYKGEELIDTYTTDENGQFTTDYYICADAFAKAAHECFDEDDSFLILLEQMPFGEVEEFFSYPRVVTGFKYFQDENDEEKWKTAQRVICKRAIDFYIFDLMNGLHHGHAPSQCQGCGRYFLTTNGHIPKYCDGVAPQDSRYTCRQYGAMMHQKEQNKQHPVYRLFNTRTGTIRKHHQRGKISDDLRREALYLAESYRDKALMDNDYAADGYARDMELEHIYAEAEKRLK